MFMAAEVGRSQAGAVLKAATLCRVRRLTDCSGAFERAAPYVAVAAVESQSELAGCQRMVDLPAARSLWGAQAELVDGRGFAARTEEVTHLTLWAAACWLWICACNRFAATLARCAIVPFAARPAAGP